MSSEAVDITLPGARPTLGHQHLINQIIGEIEDVFCGIGYTVEKGPQVETSYYNFTALNAPMDHPSRSARDTFYVADNAPGTAPAWQGSPRATSLSCRPKPVGPLSQRQPAGFGSVAAQAATASGPQPNVRCTAPPVPKAYAAALMERACTSRPMPAECSMVGTSCEYGKPDSFRTEPSPCCRTMAAALQSEVPITLHIV